MSFLTEDVSRFSINYPYLDLEALWYSPGDSILPEITDIIVPVLNTGLTSFLTDGQHFKPMQKAIVADLDYALGKALQQRFLKNYKVSGSFTQNSYGSVDRSRPEFVISAYLVKYNALSFDVHNLKLTAVVDHYKLADGPADVITKKTKPPTILHSGFGGSPNRLLDI